MQPHTTKSSLVSFLYELMRDELPVGTIERLTKGSETQTDWKLTNGHLGQYAEEIAHRLVPPTKSRQPEIDALKKELALYEREEGSDQCLDTIEVREQGHETHWACCYMEKDHKGKHRHWMVFDWAVEGEALIIRRGKGRKRRGRR